MMSDNAIRTVSSPSMDGALSIQERIRAMNQALDNVDKRNEQRTVVVSQQQQQQQKIANRSIENVGTIDNSSLSLPSIIVQRSSVVDIWRTRESQKNIMEGKVSPSTKKCGTVLNRSTLHVDEKIIHTSTKNDNNGIPSASSLHNKDPNVLHKEQEEKKEDDDGDNNLPNTNIGTVIHDISTNSTINMRQQQQYLTNDLLRRHNNNNNHNNEENEKTFHITTATTTNENGSPVHSIQYSSPNRDKHKILIDKISPNYNISTTSKIQRHNTKKMVDLQSDPGTSHYPFGSNHRTTATTKHTVSPLIASLTQKYVTNIPTSTGKNNKGTMGQAAKNTSISKKQSNPSTQWNQNQADVINTDSSDDQSNPLTMLLTNTFSTDQHSSSNSSKSNDRKSITKTFQRELVDISVERRWNKTTDQWVINNSGSNEGLNIHQTTKEQRGKVTDRWKPYRNTTASEPGCNHVNITAVNKLLNVNSNKNSMIGAVSKSNYPINNMLSPEVEIKRDNEWLQSSSNTKKNIVSGENIEKIRLSSIEKQQCTATIETDPFQITTEQIDSEKLLLPCEPSNASSAISANKLDVVVDQRANQLASDNIKHENMNTIAQRPCDDNINSCEPISTAYASQIATSNSTQRCVSPKQQVLLEEHNHDGREISTGEVQTSMQCSTEYTEMNRTTSRSNGTKKVPVISEDDAAIVPLNLSPLSAENVDSCDSGIQIKSSAFELWNKHDNMTCDTGFRSTNVGMSVTSKTVIGVEEVYKMKKKEVALDAAVVSRAATKAAICLESTEPVVSLLTKKLASNRISNKKRLQQYRVKDKKVNASRVESSVVDSPEQTIVKPNTNRASDTYECFERNKHILNIQASQESNFDVNNLLQSGSESWSSPQLQKSEQQTDIPSASSSFTSSPLASKAVKLMQDQNRQSSSAKILSNHIYDPEMDSDVAQMYLPKEVTAMDCTGQMCNNKPRLSSKYNTAARFIETDASDHVVLQTCMTDSESSCNESGNTSGSCSRFGYEERHVLKEELSSKRRSIHDVDRSRNFSKDSSRSNWESDWSGNVSFGTVDFDKFVAVVDDHVTAIRNFVGGNMKSISEQKQKSSSTAPSRRNAPMDAEDIAIEVEYVEDSFDDDDPKSDLGFCTAPVNDIVRSTLNFSSKESKLNGPKGPMVPMPCTAMLPKPNFKKKRMHKNGYV